MAELIDKLIQMISYSSRETKIAIIVAGVVIFILFVALLQRFSKAKCPKCKKRKCKELSSSILEERKVRNSRTVNGETEYYDEWIRKLDITYECQKCGCKFNKKETRTSEY